MELYYIIVFFIFGLVFGSFFNVVGYRLPKKKSLIKPASHCTKCNHKLTPIELIPVFSYILQGGKCKKCKSKISIFYPIFELLTACLFALAYIIFGISIETVIAIVFTSMILIITLSDILYMIIPDSLLIVSGILIFILKIYQIDVSNIIEIIIDIAVSFIVMYLLKLLGNYIFKKESLGGGDIKLMLIFGLVLGWEISLCTIFIASFIALPISIINLCMKKNHELPFGPYLGIAALICLYTQIDISTIINLLY